AGPECRVAPSRETDPSLHPYRFANGNVLDGPPLGRRNTASSVVLACLQQRGEPQQAAYMIGAKWRPRSSGHGPISTLTQVFLPLFFVKLYPIMPRFALAALLI